MHADLATRAESLLQDAQELVDDLRALTKALRAMAHLTTERRKPWPQMLQRVAKAHGVPVEKMLTGKQINLVEARLDAYAQLRAAGYSCAEIATFCRRSASCVRTAMGER